MELPSVQLPTSKDIAMDYAMRFFDDEEMAESWFISQRWPNGIACPNCDGMRISERPSRKPMPYRCRDCRRYFSPKSNTPLAHSNLPISTWAKAIYLYVTLPKGISSWQASRYLGVSQKTSWHLLHRLREAWSVDPEKKVGPVEVDETLVGGTPRRMHADKRRQAKRLRYDGKTPVLGMVDRRTNTVVARVAPNTEAKTLYDFISRNAHEYAILYTDGAPAYKRASTFHDWVDHSKGEYVRGEATTNRIESFWSILKRAHKGTHHWWSIKHLQRFLNEFASRHNFRPKNDADRMAQVVSELNGRHLSWNELIAAGLKFEQLLKPRPKPVNSPFI